MIYDNIEILSPKTYYFIRKVRESNCGTPKEKISICKGSSFTFSAIF